MEMIVPKAQNADVNGLSIEQQLQLAAANFGGTLESRLTGAAIATVVSRMVQLDEKDQEDLFECVKDLSTIRSKEDAQETMKTILEILEPGRGSGELLSLEQAAKSRSRGMLDEWIVRISNCLRETRESKGLTQQELAQMTGLPQSHISRLESGKHSPSRKTVQKIADALGIDAKELLLED